MKRHHVDTFVVIALFCVYAALAFLLAGIGAGIYKDTTRVMETNYDVRTSSLYVAEKLRQSDLYGSVEVRSLDGSDALVIIERESGEAYEIWLYVHEGMLCETLIAPGTQVNYQLGQSIMPVQAMRVSQSAQGSGTLLTVSFTMADGNSSAIDLFLRSQAGEG